MNQYDTAYAIHVPKVVMCRQQQTGVPGPNVESADPGHALGCQDVDCVFPTRFAASRDVFDCKAVYVCS